MDIEYTVNPLQKILPEDAKNYVGRKVHVRWAHPGCVWRILKVTGDEVLLETPKTDKKRIARTCDLIKLRNDSDKYE